MAWANYKGVMAEADDDEEQVVFNPKPAAVRPSRRSSTGISKKKSVAVAAKKGANKAEKRASTAAKVAKAEARGDGLYKAGKPPPVPPKEPTILSPWKGVDTQNAFAALEDADEMAVEAGVARSPKKRVSSKKKKPEGSPFQRMMESAANAVKEKAAEISKQVADTAARAKENAQQMANNMGKPTPQKDMGKSKNGTPIARRTRGAAKVFGEFTSGIGDAVNNVMKALSPRKKTTTQSRTVAAKKPSRLRA